MNNKVILYYKRPKRIEENAEWQKKDYTYYTSSLGIFVQCGEMDTENSANNDK